MDFTFNDAKAGFVALAVDIASLKAGAGPPHGEGASM